MRDVFGGASSGGAAHPWLSLARDAALVGLPLWAGAQSRRLARSLRAFLSRHAARLALWLCRDETLRETEQARRVVEFTRAAHASHTTRTTYEALPAVLALPRFDHPAQSAERALRELAETSGAATRPLPAVSWPSSSTRAPSLGESRAPRRPREAAPFPGVRAPLPPTAPTLGGVSAFARALGRDTDPAFPNVTAVVTCLCDALHAIELAEPDYLDRVADNLACATLQLPRQVDAALFALLPTSALPSAGDAPDSPYAARESDTAPEAVTDDEALAGMPDWMQRWLLSSAPGAAPEPESEPESEPHEPPASADGGAPEVA